MAMHIFFASPGTKIPATYTTQYTELNTSWLNIGTGSFKMLQVQRIR